MANADAEGVRLLGHQLHTVSIDGPASQYIRLNVGGYFFSTTIGTLTSRDTMLRAMFSGKMEILADQEGWILIDRSGKHFGRILNWLRDGHIPLPASQNELEELALEAKYYLCEELQHLCEAKLNSSRAVTNEPEPICQVPYVTHPLEEQMLLLTTKRPVVKLQINRHNNKYSYTSASEENLLKSLELFDKMALKFCRRVLFIKDVVSTNEICCWVFYGNGKKLAEVCCTSIVYTSDKGKHTKVEFPESRILEETLNILLYERPFVQMFPPPGVPQGLLSPADAAAINAVPTAGDAAGGSPATSGAAHGAAIARSRHVQQHHHHQPIRQASVEQQPDVVGSGTFSHHVPLSATTSRANVMSGCSSSSNRVASSQQQTVRLPAGGVNNAVDHNNEPLNGSRSTSSTHSLTRGGGSATNLRHG